MRKSSVFFIFSVFLWCVGGGSSEEDHGAGRLVCLLEDQKDQCGSYCMLALKPLLDRIAKHQDQWSTSYSQSLSETQAKLDRIEGQQEALEKTLRAAVDEKLDRITDQQKIDNFNLLAKLDRMEALWQKNFEALVEALEDQLKDLPVTQNSIPPYFQKIAQRYFYIERNIKLNWFAASAVCRSNGFELALIQNEEERQALAAEVNAPSDVGFWLDIHNLANDIEYISSATGKEAPFIKWGRNQPNGFLEACVALDDGEMHDYNCMKKLFFICQA